MPIPQLKWNNISFKAKLISSLTLLVIVVSCLAIFLLFSSFRWSAIGSLILALVLSSIFVALLSSYLISQDKLEELKKANKELRAEQEVNAKLYEARKTMYVNSIKALVIAIDAKDPYTSGHSTRVAEHATKIAQELGLEKEEIENLQFAGLLHDIGKICIADEILRKVGPLEPDEQAIMMAHPVISYSILNQIDSLKDLLPPVRHHHERYSGGGYPAGLTGENIPLGARVLSVADAFESMTSPRRYRQALSVKVAIGELKKGKGTQFDPEIVEALQRIINRERAANSRYFRELIERTHFQKEITKTSSFGNRFIPPGQIRPIHGKEIAILSQIAQEIRSVLSLPTLLGHILDILKGIHGHKYYAILLKNEETGDLVVEACRGFPPETVGLSIAASKGLVGWVAEHQEAQLVIDTTTDTRCDVGFPWNKGAEIAIPLVVEEQAIGILDIQSEVPGEFTPEDLHLFKAVGTQISAGVEVALLHEQVKRATAYDGLTGIYNHRYFYKRLEEELNRAQREATPLSIVIFDIDKLKEINDTHGHLVGDAVLKETAHTLQENLRLSDIAARYGGDEFVIIMPNTTKEEAESSTQRLMARLDQRKIKAGKNLFPLPGRSYGLATYPEDGIRPTELFTVADNLLLHKKRKRVVGTTR